MKSVLNVSQVVARGMVADKRGGAIVNISSVDSFYGQAGGVLHCSSKGALDQITRCMAVECGPHQIRVNSINPTLVPDTTMGHQCYELFPLEALEELKQRTPMAKFAKTEDVVNATLFLLSEKADMINGALLPVDGGFLCT